LASVAWLVSTLNLNSVAAKERERVRAVEIVLVRGRLVRLRLDEERAGEPDLLLVLHRHVHELRQVIEFALEVGVEERDVALAPAPEDVVFAAEFLRHFERLLHLRRGVREHVGVATRARAVNEPLVREQVRGAPQQLDAGALLLLLEFLGDGIENLVRFGEVRAFGRDVAVVPAVVRHAEFLHELERDIDALERHLDGIGAVFPRAHGAAGAERVAAHSAERVPVAHREPQVLAHRLAFDQLVGVVVPVRERVGAVRAFVLDLRHVREERHCWPARCGKGE
jgi:hypothetical protein